MNEVYVLEYWEGENTLKATGSEEFIERISKALRELLETEEKQELVIFDSMKAMSL